MSLPTPTTRPVLVGGDWDTLCAPWDGRAADYPARALAAAQDRLGRMLPWVNVEPVCGTPACLTPGHLGMHSPRRIAYPHGVCVYCGMPADSKDHLLPQPLTGSALRRFVAVVPACRPCNSTIGTYGDHRITQRRAEAHRGIRRQNAKYLRLPDRWPPSELAELGPVLRRRVEAGLQRADWAQARLAWPDDPAYDVRAFEKSGLPDPIALDLL